MFRKAMLILCIFALLAACSEKKAAPTATPMPPTQTVPPTNTAPPPTATTKPTATIWPTVPPPPPYPAGRVYAPIVYSPKADRALMFSGGTMDEFNSGGFSHDAWLYDPQTGKWEKAQRLPTDCNWFDYGGVYDSQADRVLVYCSGVGSKLVEYDFQSNTWSDRKSANTPSGAHNTRMVYDAESNKTILVGGISFRTPKEQFEGTWAYDYPTNTWTKMNPKIQPPGLYGHTLVYDTESDRVILWAGRIWVGNWNEFWSSNAPENMVWTYDYNTDTWESFPITGKPKAPDFYDFLQYVASTYISDLDRCLYYWGSSIYTYDFNQNTWEVAKGDLKGNIGYRIVTNMVYLESISRVLVFGGHFTSDDNNFPNDTWLYDPKTGEWTQAGP